MKTLEDFKQEQMQDKEFKQAYDEIQLIADNRAIQELERLKADFISDVKLYQNEYDGSYNCSQDYIVGVCTCIAIIDNHISKLKGENNDENINNNL